MEALTLSRRGSRYGSAPMAELHVRLSHPVLPQGPLGQPADSGLDLALTRGLVSVVWGLSASGKSSLARRVAAEVRVADRALRCTIIPSNPYLLFDGVLGNVSGELRWSAQRAGRVLSTEQLDDLLGSADLDRFADQPIWKLSGGEAVRTAIAVARALAPDVLILDDVLTSLDEANLATVLAALHGEAARGAAILILQTPTPSLRAGLRHLAAQNDLAAPARPSAESCRRWTAVVDEILLLEPPAAVRLRDVVYGYDRGPSFHLADAVYEPGQCYVSAAANGQGKTSLFRALNGVVALRGRVLARGNRDLRRRSSRQAVSFMQVQEPQYQLGARTVAAEVAAVTSRQRPEVRARCVGALDALLGVGVAAANPFSLPRPYQRLLMVLLACFSHRPLLLFDEPSVGLDDGLSQVLRECLLAATAGGRTVLVATHDGALSKRLNGQTLPLGVRQGHSAAEGRRTTRW